MGISKHSSGMVIGMAAIFLSGGYYLESRAYLEGAQLGTASSGLYTLLLAGGMALCGGLCVLRVLLRGQAAQKRPSPMRYGRFVLVLLLAALYVVSLEYLGYLIASVLTGGILLYIMKETNFLRLILFPAAYALTIYAMFVKGLLINLPEPWFLV